jgi:hypothetical protein
MPESAFVIGVKRKLLLSLESIIGGVLGQKISCGKKAIPFPQQSEEFGSNSSLHLKESGEKTNSFL